MEEYYIIQVCFVQNLSLNAMENPMKEIKIFFDAVELNRKKILTNILNETPSIVEYEDAKKISAFTISVNNISNSKNTLNDEITLLLLERGAAVKLQPHEFYSNNLHAIYNSKNTLYYQMNAAEIADSFINGSNIEDINCIEDAKLKELAYSRIFYKILNKKQPKHPPSPKRRTKVN